MDDFDWIDNYGTAPDDKQLETSVMTSGYNSVKVVVSRKMRVIMRKDAAKEAIDGNLPSPGEALHFITNAKYDFWMIVTSVLDALGVVEKFYGSTWTMNRGNAEQLLQFYDSGKIKSITMLTGLYFKRRETAVYSRLLAGLSSRGQKLISFKNHAKIILMKSKDNHIVIEGSANFTNNPRLENFAIINDKKLFKFHQGWMEQIIENESKTN